MIHPLGYVYNDGGRAKAGFKGKTGDCLIRAIAIASRKPYRVVYDATRRALKAAGYRATGDAGRAGKKTKRGQPTVAKVQESVLKQFGFEKLSVAHMRPRPSYAEAFNMAGNCIVRTTKHWAAIVDGDLHDISDGRTYQASKFGQDLDGSWKDFTVDVERRALSIWIAPS